MKSKNLVGAVLLIISLILPGSRAMAAVWTDHYDVSNGYSLAGEGVSTITFDDWGYTGPLGRNAKDFAPINGFGPLGQQQHVVTLWPDRLTPDSPSSILKDITNTPVYTNANMDAQVNFYHWGYTTPGFDRQSDYTAYKAKDYSASTRPGCIFDNMLIDQDGDYFVSKSDMHFGYYDKFSYVDATGVNPPQDVVTTLSFQPYPVSDAIGWCGSALLDNPTALKIMAGQLTFDFAFDVYNGPNRSFMGTQIAPGFQMRSYGTLNVNVRVGSDQQTFSSNAVINNTYPGNTDSWDLDPAFINNVSFHGGGVLPDGVWVSADSFNPDGSRKLNPNGTWNVTVVPAGTPGAQWHINAFAGFAFILRADGIRLLDWYDPAHFGPDPCADKNCDDGNICTTDTCVGGVCVNVNNTAPCSDNNACTTGDVCSNGVCQPGTPVNCDDGNSCTTDVCDMTNGNCTNIAIPGCGSCSGKPDGAPCSDGDPCTLNDFCTNETCAGPPKNCNDGNACTDDSCDPVSGNCVHVNNSAPCSDGNACTTGDMCSNGACTGTSTNCDDGNPGTDDSCDTATGACVHTPNSNPCNDGNACTTGDVYSNGVCSGTPKNCDDGNLCTDDSCDAATGDCLHTPIPNCTAEQLQGRLLIETGTYFCMGAPYPNGSCVPFTGGYDGGLILGQYQPMHILPDICGNDTGSGLGTGYSLPETGGPAAIAAVYNFFGVPTYPSTNAVSWQTCNLHTAPTVTAGAVDPVTGCRALSGDISAWDVFWNGSVFEQGPREGTPTNPIKVYAQGKLCPDNSYVLSWPALIVNGPFNGVTGYYLLVGHHNPCTTATCDDGNLCTDESFDPAACQCIHTPNTKPCNDNNAGTTGDTCSGGVCVGIPANCDDGNVCTTDTVDPLTGACVHTFNTAPCNDGDPCTVNDTCAGGVCVAGTPKNCDDGNACTTDSCDGSTGACIHTIICGPAADPLPAGTILGIDPGNGAGAQCTTGSCFGMEVAPGFVVWTDYGPGTDGGFVVGKAQVSGGQEAGPSPDNATPGDLSSAWLFFSNYGTFFTSPDGGALNKFDKAPCSGSACFGKTELKVLNVAWNGGLIPMGSAAGCTLPACTPDQLAGIFVNDYQIDPVTGAWSMNYSQVVPSGQFSGVKFSTIIRGSVTMVDPCLDAATRCNDNNACTTDTCDPTTGACINTPKVCTASDQCHVAGTCAPATGVCSNPNAPNGTTCNDNNLCTSNDVCTTGVCRGTAKVCNDNNICTTDTCNASTGNCVFTNNTLPCPDGNGCTTNVCGGGVCTSTPLACCSTPAVPLPSGTLLGIVQGTGSGSNKPCATGSCFGMEVSPGVVQWTDYGPGTDGGIVVGKAQTSGGQELAGSPTQTTPGQLSAAWLFFSNYGTFFTNPGGDTQNIFDSAPCAGGCCTGKTELNVFNVAWNGNTINMGSAAGCILSSCTNTQKDGVFVNDYQINPVTGGAWSMNYSQVVPSGQFKNVKFSLILRGTVIFGDSCPDDGNPCTIDALVFGVCTHTPVAAGTACDDNNACTTNDACNANGVCVGTAIVCTASDQCHLAGVCTAGVCSNPIAPNGTPCEDGNLCSGNDTCQAGICQPGIPIVCTPIDQCHLAGTCNPATGICSIGPHVSDPCCGDPCCGLVCPALDQCHIAGTCDPATGICSNPIKTNGTSCNDNNACTSGDVCNNGVCGGTAVLCTASDQCHVAGICDPATGVCSNPPAPDGTSCSDGNACTVNDVCTGGVCSGTLKNCNDGNCCTTDSCDPTTGACINTAIPGCGTHGSPLRNGVLLGIDMGNGAGAQCTTGSCFGMEVAPGFVVWTDFGPGTDGGFVVGKDQANGELSNQWMFFGSLGTFNTMPGGSTNPFDSAACSGTNCVNKTELNVLNVFWNGMTIPMGSPCGVSDYQINPITGGLWSMNYASSVPAGDPSSFGGVKFSMIVRGTVDLCTDAASRCNDNNLCTDDTCDPATGNCIHTANTAPCSDGNACTLNDTCSGAVCVPGTAKVCNDNNVCTNDSCDPATGACVFTNNTSSCNDGNACTVSDICSGGVCAGTPMNCDDNNACTSDSCVAGACQHAAITCNDNNDCTTDSCDPATGCVYTPIAGTTKSVTIRGGGQKPAGVDLQIQTNFTVQGSGCIVGHTVSSITVTPGTILQADCHVGQGPQPSTGTYNGAPMPVDVGTHTIVCPAASGLTGSIYLDNKANGGKDVDRMTVSVQ